MEISEIIRIEIATYCDKSIKLITSTIFNNIDKKEMYNDAIRYVCNKWNFSHKEVKSSFQFILNAQCPSDDSNFGVIKKDVGYINIWFYKKYGV